MPRSVEIDPHSGFCGGVIRAIGKAEDFLEGGKTLYSLGAIVHNDSELDRLAAKGLVTVGQSFLDEDGTGKALLIRAHGEPPETYARAAARGFDVIDCTCPVVLQLQKSIREAWGRLHEGTGGRGTLIIFGKIGHAEVLGLQGQVEGQAIVVEDILMLEAALDSGQIRTDAAVEIFSQTTKSPAEYAAICALLRERMPDPSLLTVHETICSQVAMRHARMPEFAAAHDVIIFVSGRASSNGQVLSDLCRKVNPRTHLIGGPGELKPEWFSKGDSVGVCGATSTPKWLLEEVGSRLLSEFPGENPAKRAHPIE